MLFDTTVSCIEIKYLCSIEVCCWNCAISSTMVKTDKTPTNVNSRVVQEYRPANNIAQILTFFVISVRIVIVFSSDNENHNDLS